MANLIRKRHAAPSSIWRDADLTRLFEDLFTPTTSSAAFVPSIELSENENDYLISAELPGIGENDVDVQVDDNNVLTIRGEKKSEVRESRGGSEFSERTYGEFVRSIQLPPTIDAANIEGTYENGVLQLRVPKAAETRARKIPIGKEKEKKEPEKAAASELSPAPAEAQPAPSETKNGEAPPKPEESDGHQPIPQQH